MKKVIKEIKTAANSSDRCTTSPKILEFWIFIKYRLIYSLFNPVCKVAELIGNSKTMSGDVQTIDADVQTMNDDIKTIDAYI